jgi:hypothetical protein
VWEMCRDAVQCGCDVLMGCEACDGSAHGNPSCASMPGKQEGMREDAISPMPVYTTTLVRTAVS